MSNYRRGIVRPNAQPVGPAQSTTSKALGRVHNTNRPPARMLAQQHQYQQHPEPVESESIILNQHGAPVSGRRRGLVNAGGHSLKGLQAATLAAQKDARDVEAGRTELCSRCGKERGVSSMITLVQGHDNDGREGTKVRICTPCKSQSYKNPQEDSHDVWKPERQDVRFNEEARPYDALDVGIGELMNGDSYHAADLEGKTEAPRMPHFVASGRIGK